MDIMKKEELRRLCRERSIPYNSKDTVATLRALLESSTQSAVNDSARESTTSPSTPKSVPPAPAVTLSAPPVPVVPSVPSAASTSYVSSLGNVDSTALVGAVLSALTQAGLTGNPAVRVPTQSDGSKPQDSSEDIDSASTFSEATDLVSRKRRRIEEDGNEDVPTDMPPPKRGKRIPISLRYPIPEAVKKKVLNGEYVPIVKLLNGYNASVGGQMVRTGEDGTLRVSLSESSHDKQLAKNPLDISLLVLGLQKYKSILVDYDTKRADDIENYISNLLYIHVKFPGLSYWLYHKYFWNRVFLEGGAQGSHPLDWSSLDAEALHMATATYGPSLHCDHCQTYAHATARCPFQVGPSRSAEQTSSNVELTKATHHKGKEICHDFNAGRCRATSCSKLHCCSYCTKFDHSFLDCGERKKKYSLRIEDY